MIHPPQVEDGDDIVHFERCIQSAEMTIVRAIERDNGKPA